MSTPSFWRCRNRALKLHLLPKSSKPGSLHLQPNRRRNGDPQCSAENFHQHTIRPTPPTNAPPIQCAMYSIQCPSYLMRSIYCHSHSIQCPSCLMYSIQCPSYLMYSIQCPSYLMYSIQCPSYLMYSGLSLLTL